MMRDYKPKPSEVLQKIHGRYACDPQFRERIDSVLEGLTPRERDVIFLRYGIGEAPHTYTLEEVQEAFKVTRERIRQVEAKAIRKLRHPVRARRLEGFLGEDNQ